MATPISQLVVFALDDLQYALRLAAVERVERAVAVLPLPKAPEIVLGVINVGGRVLPVVDLRKRFRFPPRPVDVGDHLILARTHRRPVALLVDQVGGVVSFTEAQLVPAQEILPGLGYVDGIVKTRNGIILIHDLDQFLSLEEERRLDSALEGQRQ
jgi:purine-binding chemotaxis protein CheW